MEVIEGPSYMGGASLNASRRVVVVQQHLRNGFFFLIFTLFLLSDCVAMDAQQVDIYLRENEEGIGNEGKRGGVKVAVNDYMQQNYDT